MGCFPWPRSSLCSRRFVEAFPRACQSSCEGWVWASLVSRVGLTHLSLAAFGVQLPLRASSQLVLGHVFPAIREVVCIPDRRQCVCLYVCPCKHCFCLLCARKRFSPLRGFGDSWGGEGLLCPLASHREVSQGTCVALGLYPRYTLSSLQLSSCCVIGHSLLMFVQATSLCYTGCAPCAGSKLWGYGLAPACNQWSLL